MKLPALYAGLTGDAPKKPPPVGKTTGSFVRQNLLSTQPNLGFVKENKLYKPKMYDNISKFADRRVMSCRNDLRVVIGNPPKDHLVVRPPLVGIGRRTHHKIFPRPQNNLPVLVPANSADASRPSKLGIRN
jgi:hypothetical protein